MANNLTRTEQLPVPTPQNAIPSLPVWITTRVAALAPNLQMDEKGKFHEPLTLPPALVLREQEREDLEAYLQASRSLLAQTPENSEQWEKETFALIGKMILVKPSRSAGPGTTEARVEVYAMALDDVPSWAVQRAIRKWHRGECGTDQHGRTFDYRWAPESADLRNLAQREVYDLKERIAALEKLLGAVPFRDCSEELKKGCAAFLGLRIAIKDGNLDPSFDEAAEIGKAAAGTQS